MKDNVPKNNNIEAETESKELNAKDLEKLLEDCKRKNGEYLAGWQRARADFLNYKKDEMERIERLLSYAGIEFILKLLPILDNFDITEKRIPDSLKNDENVKGLLLIKNQTLDFLKNQGVEEIKSIGEKFNPNLHEVVEEITESQEEPGIIIEETQKGYKINGELLRPTRVKISK